LAARLEIHYTPKHGSSLPDRFLTHFKMGFDHGVGHSLLLLSDAKASHAQKSKEFNGLGHYPSNISIRLLQTTTKRIIHTTI
jgi:hypothetical protein